MTNGVKFKLKSKYNVRSNVEYCGKFPDNNSHHIIYVNEKNEISFTTIDDCEIITN